MDKSLLKTVRDKAVKQITTIQLNLKVNWEIINKNIPLKNFIPNKLSRKLTMGPKK